MSLPDHTTEELPSRPFGPIGLAVSLPLILCGALVLCAIAAALAFVAAIVVHGRQETLARFVDLRTAAGSNEEVLQQVGIIVSLVAYAAVSACVFFAARLRGGLGWRALIGWWPWSLWRAGRVFWIVVPATIVYSVVADILVSRLYPPSQEWVKLPEGALWAALFVLLAVVFAPVAEELVFRGWLYTGLRPRIGRWLANLLTSVLFALAHWEKTHIYALAVFPVGVALAFVRERAGSIKASMTFHATFNAVAAIMLGIDRLS